MSKAYLIYGYLIIILSSMRMLAKYFAAIAIYRFGTEF